VRDIAYEYIEEKERKCRPYMPKWLGIDEIVLNERVDEFCCVLVDIERGKLIDLLPDCRIETVATWLRSFGENPNPRGVCMDMCATYRTAVTRVFPNVEIVVDKFRVVELANKAVNTVRMSVGKSHPEEKRSDGWRRNRTLLRKRGRTLSAVERLTLDSLLSRHPDLATAYRLKEEFYGIYDHNERRAATRALEEWERSVPEHMRSAFKHLLTAVANLRKEILSYFGNEKTIACTEAISSRFRDVLQAGRGYSFQVLRGKVLFG
jgi:transposase